MSMQLRHKYLRWLMLALGISLVSAIGYPAWRHLYPVAVSQGWGYQVFHADIPKVSALVQDEQGALFISQELSDGKGSILKRERDGSLTTMLSGLSKPDGLALYGGGVAVGQEGGKFPVLLLRGNQTEPLFGADDVESLASDGHFLYAIEDKKLGRLLRFDPLSGEVVTLRDGLDEGEAITACADGRLFYTEKSKGWVKQWQASGADTLVQAGLNAPGFLLCSADGLWITEDATHMARVLLLNSAGQLQVILDHMRAAQTIIATTPGNYLVAEQGRDRILELNRLPNGS